MSNAVAKREQQLPQSREVDLTKAVAIHTKSGELKMFKTQVPLSIEAGTMVKPFGMNVTLCTADGYKEQAKFGGLIADMLPTVVVDGQEQGNPYVMRDDKGRITMVYCRAFCFGYTPMGIPTVVSKTVVFDIRTYELVDILAKAKQKPGDFKIRPIEMEAPGKNWAKYPIDENVAIFCNTESEEFTKWQIQIMNRKRKAVEITQTFAIRNAIKSHPNVKFHKLDKGSSTVVPMLCWRAVTGEMRWDRSQYEGFTENVQNAVSGEAKDIETVDAGTDALHEEHEIVEADVAATEADELSNEDPTIDEEVHTDERAPHITLLKGLKKSHPEAYKKAAKDCGLKSTANPEDQPDAKLYGWSNLAADYAAAEE